MRLDDGEIPRKFIRHLIAQADAALEIIVDPRAQHGGVELFAPRRARCRAFAAAQILAPRARRASGASSSIHSMPAYTLAMQDSGSASAAARMRSARVS